MKAKQIATMLATVLFAAMAYAGDTEQHKMKIELISDDGGDATHLTLDSADLGFNLHDLEVGENRSVVDKEGRPILITRNEKGFSFDVDGKTIDMPALDGAHGESNVWVMKGDHGDNIDIDVEMLHEAGSGGHTMATKVFGAEGVMIISEKEIDEATQSVIRMALESAGHEGVHFAGGHGDGGPHKVHVVKKVVEVTE
jgi:hypothetical protein